MTTENTHPIAPVSYQSICPINTPKGVRRKLHIGDIFENKAKCVICNDVVMSKNRHDSVSCTCGNLTVDGGSWYMKRSCYVLEDYEELSIYYNDATPDDGVIENNE